MKAKKPMINTFKKLELAAARMHLELERMKKEIFRFKHEIKHLKRHKHDRH